MSQIKIGKRILTLAGFPAIALLTMGIAMPSCPGQQAIQQQIDALTTRANESDQKLLMLLSQITIMRSAYSSNICPNLRFGKRPPFLLSRTMLKMDLTTWMPTGRQPMWLEDL
jgi:hypothetical protein